MEERGWEKIAIEGSILRMADEAILGKSDGAMVGTCTDKTGAME